MEKLTLVRWICQNREKWEWICGISDDEPTLDEIARLYYEILKLAQTSQEFSAIFTVVLSKYYDDLFPNGAEI